MGADFADPRGKSTRRGRALGRCHAGGRDWLFHPVAPQGGAQGSCGEIVAAARLLRATEPKNLVFLARIPEEDNAP